MRIIPNAVIVLVASSLSGCATVNMDVTNNFSSPVLIIVQGLNSRGDETSRDERTVGVGGTVEYEVTLSANSVEFLVNAANTVVVFPAPSGSGSTSVSVTINPDGSAVINQAPVADADDGSSAAGTKGSFGLPTLGELLPIPFLESDDDNPPPKAPPAAARPGPTRDRE